MIDYVVVVQAVVFGGILWRAAQEESSWDRAGFGMLAGAAALMTFRRATSNLDRWTAADKIVLPQFIAWSMAGAMACFVLQALVRLANRDGTHRDPHIVGWRRIFWPMVLMLCTAAVDFVPSPRWDGVSTANITNASVEALAGANVPAACEQVRWECARRIDRLFVVASTGGEDAAVAKQKLQSLALQLEVLPR